MVLTHIANPALFACLERRGGSVRGPCMVQVGPVSVEGPWLRCVTSESSIRGALLAHSAICLHRPSFFKKGGWGPRQGGSLCSVGVPSR